ncbi:ABC transporter ATP-binding protein [Clostridium akagii]|uniref:ABC transporter ATP-binding protein n=1 Tax=Clostridium akagii TaxID=91623 RepID=UPI00047ECEEC|nr:ABC transporter ATP-binding protein [Clostridium akagii]
MPLLEVRNLTIRFEGLIAVSDFSITMGEHDLVGLIGPNGAGKTTIFNMLTGVRTPTEGIIQFAGEDITKIKPYQITKKRMARTFQNIRLFKDVSVLDNVKISFNFRVKYNLFDSIFRLPKFFREEEEIEEKAINILKIFRLDNKKHEMAANLSYGEQRRLEIARALAASPKLLLLDEPAAGMNPQETQELTELIKWVKNEYKISILLIEHDMKLVMNLCEKIVVLDYGKKIAEGTPEEIKTNKQVIKAYLGDDADA